MGKGRRAGLSFGRAAALTRHSSRGSQRGQWPVRCREMQASSVKEVRRGTRRRDKGGRLRRSKEKRLVLDAETRAKGGTSGGGVARGEA